MSGKPQALVATCMSSKIQSTVNDWLAENNLQGQHDRVAIFGSVKNREVLMGQLRLSFEKNGVKKVFLFSHEGCSAYADRAFANIGLEREALENDLNNTKAAIMAEMNEIKVRTFVITNKKLVEEVE